MGPSASLEELDATWTAGHVERLLQRRYGNPHLLALKVFVLGPGLLRTADCDGGDPVPALGLCCREARGVCVCTLGSPALPCGNRTVLLAGQVEGEALRLRGGLGDSVRPVPLLGPIRPLPGCRAKPAETPDTGMATPPWRSRPARDQPPRCALSKVWTGRLVSQAWLSRDGL